MTGGTHCHVCHGHFREHEFVACPDCGETYHESCLEYHAEFECPECADDADRAIDAQEF